mgnify:CR=1 FL=1
MEASGSGGGQDLSLVSHAPIGYPVNVQQVILCGFFLIASLILPCTFYR